MFAISNFATEQDLPTSVNGIVILPFRKSFIFPKPSRKFLNAQNSFSRGGGRELLLFVCFVFVLFRFFWGGEGGGQFYFIIFYNTYFPTKNKLNQTFSSGIFLTFLSVIVVVTVILLEPKITMPP